MLDTSQAGQPDLNHTHLSKADFCPKVDETIFIVQCVDFDNKLLKDLEDTS